LVSERNDSVRLLHGLDQYGLCQGKPDAQNFRNVYRLNFQLSLMAIYSYSNRLKLARWVKYAIFINVITYILLIILWIIELGPQEAGIETGKNIFSLLGFSFIAYLVQEKLQKPDDDFWRKFAEILGSIQVFFVCLGLIIAIVAFIFGFYAVFMGIPINTNPQSVTTVTTYTYKTVVTYTTTLKEYSDPSLGFKIKYPESWTYQKNKELNADWVTDTTFSSSDGKTGFQVQVSDSVPSGYEQVSSPSDWAKNAIDMMNSNTKVTQLSIISNEKTSLAGYQSHKLEYTAFYSGTKLHNVQYFVLNGKKGYNIFFFSTDDEFNNRWDIGQGMFNSLEITG